MFIFATGVEPNKPPCHSRQVFKTTNFITFEMRWVQLISMIGCSIAVPVVQNDGGGEEERVVQAYGHGSGDDPSCTDLPCVFVTFSFWYIIFAIGVILVLYIGFILVLYIGFARNK